MRILTIGLVLAALTASSTAQNLRQDVLNFTGNARAKMIWVRAPKDATSENHYNGTANTTLMCFSTDETASRVLDPTVGRHNMPFISRSGEYVLWFSLGSASNIINWDGSNKRTILTKSADTAFMVVAVHWDETANKEYLYFTTETRADIWVEGNKMYRAEFSNGNVIKSTKTCVLDVTTAAWKTRFDNVGTEGEYNFRIMPMLVSGDGKYAVANQPWPFIWGSDLTGGTDNTMIGGADNWACHPNLAPDKSYRVFHLNPEHTAFIFYNTIKGPKGATITVATSAKMAGLKSGWDLSWPRWSNHVKYFSVGAPLTGASELNSTAQFYIGKFNDTYTDVSTYCITPNSTVRDKVGDLWIEGGEGPNKTGIAASQSAPREPNLSLPSTEGTTIAFRSSGLIEAAIYNAAGACVRRLSMYGPTSWNVNGLRNGTYTLRQYSAGRWTVSRIVLGR